MSLLFSVGPFCGNPQSISKVRRYTPFFTTSWTATYSPSAAESGWQSAIFDMTAIGDDTGVPSLLYSPIRKIPPILVLLSYSDANDASLSVRNCISDAQNFFAGPRLTTREGASQFQRPAYGNTKPLSLSHLQVHAEDTDDDCQDNPNPNPILWAGMWVFFLPLIIKHYQALNQSCFCSALNLLKIDEVPRSMILHKLRRLIQMSQLRVKNEKMRR